eukprot:RCo039627
MGAVSVLIDVLREAFVFVVQLSVDALLLGCFLLSLVLALWRAPFALHSFFLGLSEYRFRSGEFRCLMFSHLLIALMDLALIPMLVVCMLSWRGPYVIMHVKEEYSYDHELCISFTPREAVALNFFLLLADIPFILMLVWLHLCVWRVGSLWAAMRVKRDHDLNTPWYYT